MQKVLNKFRRASFGHDGGMSQARPMTTAKGYAATAKTCIVKDVGKMVAATKKR